MVEGAGRTDLNGLYVQCSEDVRSEQTQSDAQCWMLQGTVSPTTVESPIMLWFEHHNIAILPPSHDYVRKDAIEGAWFIDWNGGNGGNGVSPAPVVSACSDNTGTIYQFSNFVFSVSLPRLLSRGKALYADRNK